MHHNNVDPSSLAAYIVCCLTPLNKNLGVCPIGSGEVFQRIVERVVIRIARQTYNWFLVLQLVLPKNLPLVLPNSVLVRLEVVKLLYTIKVCLSFF